MQTYDSEEDTFDPLVHSKYYNKKQFIESLVQSNSDFSMISINCQSLSAKFENLQIYVDEISNEHPLSAIICQETGFKENTDLSLYNLSNYNMISKSATKHTDHGLVIYLHNDFIYKELNIASITTDWECLVIEISLNKPNSKKYIIGNIYRRPIELLDSFNTFLTEFNECLSKLQTQNHPIYLAGDYNINLLEIFVKNHYNNFYESITHNGFFPKITLPTRLQFNTLIDNIFMNTIDSHISGIILETFSDHQVIFTHNKCKNPLRYEKRIAIEKHDIDSLNEFVRQLDIENLNAQLDHNINSDPNLNYTKMTDILQKLKDKIMPRKFIKFNKRKHKKQPWITTGIIKSINEKDKMYKMLIKLSPNSIAYQDLKINLQTYKQIIRRSIKEAKRHYFQTFFLRYNNNTKKTWQTINATLNKKGTHTSLPNQFCSNGTMLSEPHEIANKFNDFFVNVGTHTNVTNNDMINSYLPEKSNSQFNFHQIDEQQTLQIIKHMKNKLSTGIDNISNKIIKSAMHLLYKPLTLIINQMIQNNIYPNALKVSKVIPIYKKGDKLLFSNYRPISLLPSLSKIFEKIILIQLTEYLDKNNIITAHQYGFRKKHSTELAALHLTDHISWELDKKNKPLAIFLDLSKAFDSLSHDILLSKLRHYGISGNSYDLIQSYITERYQYVKYNETDSNLMKIKQGVPQGSILGPLLFLIYINDFPSSSKLFNFMMYADDTTLYCNLNEIEENHRNLIINTELKNITQWLETNKLTLNIEKTKAMTFYLKSSKIDINLSINGNNIENVNTFNLLGLTINSQLKWNHHIDKISIKITKVY